jgi:hypothetical protein
MLVKKNFNKNLLALDAIKFIIAQKIVKFLIGLLIKNTALKRQRHLENRQEILFMSMKEFVHYLRVLYSKKVSSKLLKNLNNIEKF